MNPQDVNLSNCDREPIHQLGRIQGFGALIAVNSDWFVAHRSTNLEALFGAGRTVEIGDRLSRLLSPAALQQLRSSATALTMPDQVERLFGLALFDTDALFDCALHSSGGNGDRDRTACGGRSQPPAEHSAADHDPAGKTYRSAAAGR